MSFIIVFIFYFSYHIALVKYHAHQIYSINAVLNLTGPHTQHFHTLHLKLLVTQNEL